MRAYIHLLLVVIFIAGLEIPIFYIIKPRSFQGLLSGYKNMFTNSEVTQREDYSSRAEVFESRHRHLVAQCIKTGKPPPTSIRKSRITDRMIIESMHKILYCPAQKVASTFWRKTLSALNSNGQIDSPFSIHPSSEYRVKKVVELKSRNISLFRQQTFLRGGESLLVVRNPYAKLFSGYVDKLYHPNWLFWPQFGVTIKHIIRNNNGSHNGSTLCGNDITFAEYIKYIILQHQKGHRVNSHFSTVSAQCNPCVTKYNYVIKLETFKDDVYYILEKWRKKFKINIKFNDIEKESALDSAKTRIGISFTTKRRYAKRCNITHFNFLLRTWRFLQITGLIPISAEIPFPDGPSAEDVSPAQYFAAVKEVVSQNITWADVRRQRQEALVQAYQTIDADDMEKLRQVVKQDCLYFQYDDRPKELFHRKTISRPKSNTFNYFDGI